MEVSNIIIPVFCCILFHAFGFWVGKQTGYKSGQIDAVSGNVKYELVVHADSTRTWEYIK